MTPAGIFLDYAKHNFKTKCNFCYYGDAADISLIATYNANDKKSRIRNASQPGYTEDLVRDSKHSDLDLEPQQHFNVLRTVIQQTYNGPLSELVKVTWTEETNYSRIKENDVAPH